MKMKRINKFTNEILEEYKIKPNEKYLYEEENNRVLLFKSKEEYNKYKRKEIEDFELQEAPYYLENDEEFIFEKIERRVMLEIKNKITYGFTYKIDENDTDDIRIVNFDAISEELAEKKFSKWLNYHGFIKGENLGELISQ